MKPAFFWPTLCVIWTVACNTTVQLTPTLPAPASPIANQEQEEAELATTMMQVYPDDGSVLYVVFKGFNGDEETVFEFANADTKEFADFMIIEDATSPNGIYRAFVACDENHCQPRLFIEDLQTNETTEATFTERMPWRPLDRLTWLNDTVLAFSQSSNPHQGFRFAVDIQQRQHLLTLLIYDECLVSETCGL